MNTQDNNGIRKKKTDNRKVPLIDCEVRLYPGGGGYSHTLPIWVCAAQRGRDFEAPDLEWGIHFRGVF